MTDHNSPYVTTVIAGPESQKLDDSMFAGHKPVWLEPGVACDLYHEEIRLHLPKLDGCDVIAQPTKQRAKKLLISDMDSTMIEQECIDELADYVGIKDQVAEITERAMNGEIAFDGALRERIALLKDLPESALQDVFDTKINFMAGADVLVRTMKARGAHCVLVSGGFTFFTGRVAEALGFDAHYSNELAFENGKLTGEVVEPILGQQAKVDALRGCLSSYQIDIEDTLAVGDGANDLPMLKTAGLGVAYHAKPKVQEAANVVVNHNDLSALLYIQGIAKSDWVSA
ncbi:MAG: phosphoserine phosphatase SerB [Rickettsiales bacterium]|nr:phosphoserine phosphatase SerB [Rickettsiales bacterium]